MNFNSVEFLIFFPIILLLYYLLPQKARWVLLLAASYFFYMSWNPSLVWLILFTTFISYAGGLLIEKFSEKPKLSKLTLTVVLVACLGTLAFFKYYNFFVTSASQVTTFFGAKGFDITLDLILPVGISFYTFQTLSYCIDVYRKDIKAEKHFGYYALYVSYFPQLVAGPIERPENLLPQLKEKHTPKAENFGIGLRQMMIGFFKKVCVADILAKFVDSVFNNAKEASGFTVAVASVLFAIQIYCDFSGYTDIAIGAARLMGIKLMQNFDLPYSATSIQDFWRRWHISLSSWFRDYIYFPLGGSRCGLFRNCLNIMIVFTVSGLWHGAAWTFVLWGVIHGLLQVIGKLTLKLRNGFWDKIGLRHDGKFVNGFRRVQTFVLVSFAWMFFRANSFSDLKILLGKLFTDWKFDTMGFTASSLVMVILLIVCLVFMDRTKLKTGIVSNDGKTGISAFVLVIWLVMLCWIYLLAGGGASAFIYFQF